jgi:HK97 family phage prohead protease
MRFTAATAKQFAQDPAQGQADNGSIGTIEGYAIVWDVPSDDRGGYKVVLTRGAAQFVDHVRALYHHDYAGGPLGDTTTTTLRLTPDDYGVKASIDLPDTTLGRDVAELVRTGRVAGMSFSMLGPVEGETKDGPAGEILTVKSFVCDEVTVTAIPAFTQTSIAPAEDPQDSEVNSDTTGQYHKLTKLKLDMLSL